jgi:Sortase domain
VGPLPAVAALRTAGITGVVSGAALTAYGACVIGIGAGSPPPVDAGAVPSGPVPGPAAPGGSPADSGSPPVEMLIPALGVRARVLPVGLGTDGWLRVPPSGRDLGWWRASAAPGAGSGTVVVAGHVDTAREGPGALFRLATVPLGSRIHVRGRDGSVLTYRVAARRSYPKQTLPATVFADAGAPRLVLITCGGAFDERTRTYAENVVVYAEEIR